LFGLYLPPLAVPHGRTHKQWDSMFVGGFWRLALSRYWWLFVATVVIVFLEEGPEYDLPRSETYGWSHGILMRVLMEVMSAYATSGITLQLPTSIASLSSSFTYPSKIIIILCMIIGRHRGMDLGIDLGITDLSHATPTNPTRGQDFKFTDFDSARTAARLQSVSRLRQRR
jgi:hypothetical protein